jgi:hypothetical protein
VRSSQLKAAAVLVGSITITGCRASDHRAARLVASARSGSSVTATSSALRTCGGVPQSNGSLASKVDVEIVGPPTAVSGSLVEMQVGIRGKTADSVSVESSSIVRLLITRNGHVVGRTLGGSAGTGYVANVTSASGVEMPAWVTVSGCGYSTSDGRTPDTSIDSPDATRSPLPAGSYRIFAVVEDDSDGEENPKDLVSAPFTLTVVSSADSAGTTVAVSP